MMPTDDIDFVIPWVDGEDPAHVQRRNRRLHELRHAVPEEAVDARRFSNADELTICLQSIAAHAPWVRKVWIVTDNQTPPLKRLSAAFRKKIGIVDHKAIFRGFEDALPTFNSISIDTVIWRVEGMANRFVYFNDDFFLARKTKPEDFFVGEKPVLRGRWQAVDRDEYATKIYRIAKLNGAAQAGYGPDRWYSIAHTVVSVNRALLEAFFEEHPDAMQRNLSFPFRDESQFSPLSLAAHLAIDQGMAVDAPKKDWKTFSSDWCRDAGVYALFRLVLHRKIFGRKLVCINDLSMILAGRRWLARPLSWLIRA